MLRLSPRWLLPWLGLILLLSGCANRMPIPDQRQLLHDELFARPSRVFDARSLFELSPEMRESSEDSQTQTLSFGHGTLRFTDD